MVSKVDTAENILEDVRITFGVSAPVPYRCTETEALLKAENWMRLFIRILRRVSEARYIREIHGELPEISSADWWRNCTEILSRTVELAENAKQRGENA